MDALSAARSEGLDQVIYIGRRLPLNWLSTPAEDLIYLTAVEKEPINFDGNAREAAERFHENANVAATIAMDLDSMRLLVL